MPTTTNRLYPTPSSADTVDIPGDMQDLANAVDADMGPVVNEDIFNSVGGCSLSSTSGTYVDITGASKSFTKLGSAVKSDLIIEVNVGAFVQTSNTAIKIGVRVNSVDRDATQMLFNTANAHSAMPQGLVRVTGLAAGAYTIQLRALRPSGTGIITIDTNDTVGFHVIERVL